MAKAVRSIHRGTPSVLADVAAFVQDLVRSLYDPYRPELHYMRGPGPKWHAKHDRVPVAYQAIPALVPVRVKRFPR
jgi:hypothetical protein